MPCVTEPCTVSASAFVSLRVRKCDLPSCRLKNEGRAACLGGLAPSQASASTNLDVRLMLFRSRQTELDFFSRSGNAKLTRKTPKLTTDDHTASDDW